MTDKELKKLSRTELLEILLEQSREIERLQKELCEKNAQLADRILVINEAGSIAEASLRLTHIFEEAQKTADLYLENVKLLAERLDEPPTCMAPQTFKNAKKPQDGEA